MEEFKRNWNLAIGWLRSAKGMTAEQIDEARQFAKADFENAKVLYAMWADQIEKYGSIL